MLWRSLVIRFLFPVDKDIFRSFAILIFLVHKAGFVNILGRPNAGKSTLMNCLIGEDLSVTHSKAQTTRHRILGILNGQDYQIVYSDTPGVMEAPAYKLQEAMMEMVHGALRDADVFLLVVDVTDKVSFPEHFVKRMEDSGKPVVVCLNKIDASNKEMLNTVAEYWSGRLPSAEVIPVSAKHRFHIDQVLRTLLGHLPEHPPFFDKDQLTDRTERFFVCEIIRGQILGLYEEEIPYSVEVVPESFQDKEAITVIRCAILVARESQKAILIGSGGKAIKRLGVASRKEMESFLGRRVFLELIVKVDPDWRDNPQRLKRFGYLDVR
jgi:GTP-binding protein Era